MSRITRITAVAALAASTLLGGASLASADSGASGAAVGSPGVLSGNLVQAPVHVPVNACGNTIGLVGLLNPTFGNACVNGSGDRWEHGSRWSDDRRDSRWDMWHHRGRGHAVHHGWKHR